MASKSLIIQPLYSKILSQFPQNFSFCFAYGSGVKQQLNKSPKKEDLSSNMIDLIYCVDDPFKWHEANLDLNPSHYSFLKYLGPKFISKFQENSGAKVYFNTLVPLEDVTIKYGVISTKDLVTDLLEWSDLYVAGRLHKPVEIIKRPSSAELQTALQLNLRSAVHAALLILPESFTEYEFYHTISNLSYGGDFRMTFGENRNKVRNIVTPQLLGFRTLYRPLIENLLDYVEFPCMRIQRNQKVKVTKKITEERKREMKSSGVEEMKIIEENIQEMKFREGNIEELKVEEVQIEEKRLKEETFEERQDLRCYQDTNPMAKLHHLSQLPRWPQKALTRFWNRGNFRQDTEDVLRAIAYDPDSSEVVEECINGIVWKSSVSQSLKGIATAGLIKSVKYSGRKIVKMLK